jgi:hypothetical protein
MHPTFTARRQFLRTAAGGVLSLSLAEILALRANGISSASAAEGSGGNNLPVGRAKSCIVLFAWGGMSHLDTWDMKPLAGSDVRGEFQPIETNVPGILLSQHMPHIAARADKLAIVRSVHHKAAGHREAAYWNITGHEPRVLAAPAIMPSRNDWPSLGSMVWHAVGGKARRRGLPGSVSIPYPIADRGLVNGQYAGILGGDYDPVYVKPKQGRPYNGVSPETSQLCLDPIEGLDGARLQSRRSLVAQFEGLQTRLPTSPSTDALVAADQYRQQAYNMLSASAVREAFDVTKEPEKIRAAYGDHICGQSVLLARRLADAGVPLVTVYCGAGDLNGSQGENWDTHGDNFNRLKRDLLPPLDHASGALLDDLAATGKLDETLVVWLTEFGRTPKLGGSGRDHYPNCYSVAFAGAGVRGGQVYGRSDKIGSEPASHPVGPEHLHATIFRALGIDPRATFTDLAGRPRYLCEAEPLPLS